MMELQTAIDHVIEEGLGEKNILLDVRQADYPDKERMKKINKALETIFHAYKNNQNIELKLANALFGLAFHIQGDVDGAIGHGKSISDEFLVEEMPKMFLWIESIFSGENLVDEL